MAEYIEKEALRDWTLIPPPTPSGKLIPAGVDEIPAADVRENVRGEWIWRETEQEDYEQYWECSACGEHNFYQARFCPECGAKMVNLATTTQEPRNDFAKSNADSLRAMSDEELAEFLASNEWGHLPLAKKGWLNWLQRSVDGE